MLALHEDIVHTVCAMRYDWQVCCAGYIKLWLPVFHIGYWKPMMSTLQCICKSCSSILLPEEEFRIYLKRMRSASDKSGPYPAAQAALCVCYRQEYYKEAGRALQMIPQQELASCEAFCSR
jgi:DNA-directed RNA polymerase beta' subunit